MNFDQIIGHEKIINNFKNAIINEQIAHSYIFEGPKAIGKKAMAIAFGKTLLCENEQTEACGICSSCIQFEHKSQPDFKILDNLENTIKKSEIQELQKDIKIKPFRGDKKIYIICEAEKMTTEAQNSFLKTLEEPPDFATIILTTENKDKLLPTIVSRCQLVTFNYGSISKIEDMLRTKFNSTEERASFISNFSNGVVGRAILLSESEHFEDLREETLRAIDTTITQSKEKIFTTAEFFEKNKDNIDEILNIMLFYFRDLIIYSETRTDRHIINKDKIELIKTHYNHLEKSALHDIIDTVLSTKENIDLKVSFSLNIEMMLLEIQEGIIWQL